MKEITITLQDLEDKAACPWWKRAFALRFPNGLTVKSSQELADVLNYGGMGPVAYWASCKFGFTLDLRGADLMGATLRGADLMGAYLEGANLRRADLREADLREADLRRADLRGAYLTGAYLRRADLTNTIGMERN